MKTIESNIKIYKQAQHIYSINNECAKTYILKHKKEFTNCNDIEFIYSGIHFIKGNKNTKFSKYFKDIHNDIYIVGTRSVWMLI